MRNLLRFTATLALAITASVTLAEDVTDITLPEDGSQVVITMDYIGGFRAAPKATIGPDGKPRFEVPKPYLVIQADGTVLRSGKPIAAKKMTAEQLKKLLKFIVAENDFFNFSQAKVNAAIKASEEKFRKEQEELSKKGGPVTVRRVGGLLPVDMATTMITVELGGKKKTTKCYGYTILARHHKDIDPIQQMSRIEQKLQSVAR